MLPIIISGMPGTGSSTTAKLLAERLNLKYFIAGDLFKSIGLGKLHENRFHKEFISLSEKRNLEIPTFSAENSSDAVLSLWNSEFGKDKRFHETLDELQNEISKNGDVVVEGKIAIKIIKHKAFKVWLSLSNEERIKRTAEKDSLSLNHAERVIKERDKIEESGFQRIYGFSKNEQEKLADLVVQVENKSPEQIVSEIIKHLEHKL